MAKSVNFLLLVILLACSATTSMAKAPSPGLSSSLAARLKLDIESSNCWDSLLQLQACSTEIILFFFNGETYLGHSCCEAVRIISQQCWPAMINTLGFTSQEGNIMEGYCEKSQESSPPPPPPPLALRPNQVTAEGKVVPFHI